MEKRIETLKKALESGELVEMYSDPGDTDRFTAGCVVAMDDVSIIQRHFHPSGRADGYSWCDLEKIYRVNVRTRYLDCLKKLMEPECQQGFVPDGEEALSALLLQFAMEHEMIVQIELHDSDSWNLMGFVREVSDCVTVAMINVEGEEDGISVVRLEDITEISCGDEYGTKIEKLYRIQKCEQ